MFETTELQYKQRTRTRPLQTLVMVFVLFLGVGGVLQGGVIRYRYRRGKQDVVIY